MNLSPEMIRDLVRLIDLSDNKEIDISFHDFTLRTVGRSSGSLRSQTGGKTVAGNP